MEKNDLRAASGENLPAAPPVPEKPHYAEKTVFCRRDWIFLAISFVLGLYPAFAFSLRTLSSAPNLPGVGSALFFLAALAGGVCAIGKKGRWNQTNLLVLAAGALCALTLGVWSNFAMRALNHLAAFVLIALGLLSASGMNCRPLESAGMLCESFVNIFAACFRHFGKPFSAFAAVSSGKKQNLIGIIAGIALCIPLLAVVVALLSSADVQFNTWLARIGADFRELDPAGALWRFVRMLFFALVLFSIFYSLARPKTAMKRQFRAPEFPVSAAATVLMLMNLLYALFFLVVVIGIQSAAPGPGGYAQYARTGFFQLVAVAAINLSAVMTAAYFHPENRLRRVLSGVLCVQTVLLLAVAVWRMCLYIGAYGLSFLRLLTFYFMAVIGCAIVLCIRKDIRPGSKVFPALAAFSLALWVGFSVTDTSRIIAVYNVDAYLDGRSETVDVTYLGSLSPSVVPQLRRLAEAGNREAAEAVGRLTRQRTEYRGYNWSVDWLALP